MNTLTIFEDYFAKHLSTNPYYNEIIGLLRKQKSQTMTNMSGDYTLTLEKGIESTELQDYRISTMTCIYNFQVELNEQKMYDLAERMLKKTKESYDNGISEFKMIGVECFDKEIVGDQIQKKRGRLSKRKFRNQITLILWSRSAQKHIKTKLFRTGRAQMTGVSSERVGQDCVKFLCELLNRNADYLGLSKHTEWNPSSWSIAMMNGDFDLGKQVSREMLNSVVCKKFDVTSNLDADTYPGVIMKHTIDGKRITISVFSSGKVIITGANSRHQIETCVRMVHFLCCFT